MSDESYRTSDRRVIPWLLLGLVVLFGGMYAATHYYLGQRLPQGVSVDGVRIGGLLPQAAEARLAARLQPRADEPLTLSANARRTRLVPSASGFSIDVPASVAQARTTASWDPRRMWDHVAGVHRYDAVVHVDEPALARAVDAFASRVEDPVVEGDVTFRDGTATARYPVAGRVVDRSAALTAVRAAFLHSGPADVVVLPTRVATSAITGAAVSRAMDSFANPATSGGVEVRLARRSVQLRPQDYTAALSMRPEGTELRPVLDDAVLLRRLRPDLAKVTHGPSDATVRIVGGRPHVVPARNGQSFVARDITVPFLRVLARAGGQRVLTVRPRTVAPGFSTRAAQALRITQRVSGFATHFPYAAYRNTNIGRAARLVDGTVLRPGQTFSLNRTVGERTAANGFARGYIISDGVFAEDFGGGVSQVATTTYNAAFFAGLHDVQHKAHSFYISRYPVGREATVAWPSVDLRFRNTTPYGVLVQASLERATPSRQGTLRVIMWSTKYWDVRTRQSARYDPTPPRTRRLSGPTCVPNQGYDGFDIDVYRLLYRHGSSRLARRETVHTHYTPSDTVICS